MPVLESSFIVSVPAVGFVLSMYTYCVLVELFPAMSFVVIVIVYFPAAVNV